MDLLNSFMHSSKRITTNNLAGRINDCKQINLVCGKTRYKSQMFFFNKQDINEYDEFIENI